MATPKKAIGLSLPIQLGNEGYFATNKDTISQIADNIQNLLLTVPGERRFNNSFGSGLYNLLFQPIESDVTNEMIIDVVQRDVDKYINGTTILSVELSPQQPENNDRNSIFISITFRYNNTIGKTQLNLEGNRQDRRNIINGAKFLGYKPKVASASSTIVDIFQLLPSTRSKDNVYSPDERYCLILKPFTQLTSVSGINFVVEESIDFSQDTKFSPREITVYSRDNTGAPQFYLIKKSAKAYSGRVIIKQFSVGDQVPFYSIKLDETNVLKIINVIDSNNNNYYEVDYLAQDTIPIELDNVPLNNQTLSQYRSETPKVLKYLRTEKRFVTTIDENNQTSIQFGANTENYDNTVIIPNSSNIGVSLSNLKNLNISLDNTNVLKANSYGVSPANTTLTISYIIGGGLNSNVNSGEIKSIIAVSYLNDVTSLTDSEVTLLNTIKNSLRVNNVESSTGGDDAESNEEIRQNAILNFSTQNRMVTEDDFLLRVYALEENSYNQIIHLRIICTF